MFSLGFGVLPLVSASFSEEFGRQPLYIGSAIGYASMHLMVALSVATTLLWKSVLTYAVKVPEYPDGDCGAVSWRSIWLDWIYNGWRNYC